MKLLRRVKVSNGVVIISNYWIIIILTVHGIVVYGINTGFGKNADEVISPESLR